MDPFSDVIASGILWSLYGMFRICAAITGCAFAAMAAAMIGMALAR